MSEYDHAGEWACEACGSTFDVEQKVDPLLEAMRCPDHGAANDQEAIDE
jgi:hypothetical protein